MSEVESTKSATEAYVILNYKLIYFTDKQLLNKITVMPV